MGIIFALIVVLLGLFGIELIDGVMSTFTVNGSDEEWLAPMAMIMLIGFIILLLYFG